MGGGVRVELVEKQRGERTGRADGREVAAENVVVAGDWQEQRHV